MPKINKKITALIIVVVCISLIIGIKSFIDYSKKDSIVLISARTKGGRDAPIKITEFIDFQCPACAAGSAYLKKFMEDYPKAVRLEMKYYPLNMHRHAFMSARYAECAVKQGKFWPFHDLLMDRQNQWKRLVNAVPAFDLMAKEVNLDLKKLDACLQDERIDALIKENKSEGRSLGVKSTPTYFINGKLVVGKKSLSLEINRLLKEIKN